MTRNPKNVIAIATICLLAIGAGSAIAQVESIPSWNGQKTNYVPCTFECYDPDAKPATNGYDPQFLQDSGVKQTCQESHTDLSSHGMQDMGFCSSKLGTL